MEGHANPKGRTGETGHDLFPSGGICGTGIEISPGLFLNQIANGVENGPDDHQADNRRADLGLIDVFGQNPAKQIDKQMQQYVPAHFARHNADIAKDQAHRRGVEKLIKIGVEQAEKEGGNDQRRPVAQKEKTILKQAAENVFLADGSKDHRGQDKIANGRLGHKGFHRILCLSRDEQILSKEVCQIHDAQAD